MARVIISEYKAKKLLYPIFGQEYSGIKIKAQDQINNHTNNLPFSKTYALKVDQGIKGRLKKGLMQINLKKAEIPAAFEKICQTGFTNFLLEEYLPHEKNAEKYLSFERVRNGVKILSSKRGGADIEQNTESLKKILIEDENDPLSGEIDKSLDLPFQTISKFTRAMNSSHFSFLEINPLAVISKKIYLLDAAVEADSVGQFFTRGAWDRNDIAQHRRLTPEEINVARLSDNSPSSFKLNVLNPRGSIFLLLSGGGPSLVLADEIYHAGSGEKLANYGEYSGNPAEEETYQYALQILSLLKKSPADGKILIIGGGVANFTDIRVTFRGIVRALSNHLEYLKQNEIKIFVRRGGPYQEEGLSLLREFINHNGIKGAVCGPEIPLTKIVAMAL